MRETIQHQRLHTLWIMKKHFTVQQIILMDCIASKMARRELE
jgi:hypothetical protein